MLTDQQQQAIAAIQIATVKADIGLVSMGWAGLHGPIWGCKTLVAQARTAFAHEFHQLGAANNQCAVYQIVFI